MIAHQHIGIQPIPITHLTLFEQVQIVLTIPIVTEKYAGPDCHDTSRDKGPPRNERAASVP